MTAEISDLLLSAHRRMIQRYIEKIKESEILDKDRWILYCETALKIENPDKLSRWLGFIQGILYSQYEISIDEERDFSRDLYKPIYDLKGYDTTSVNVKSF